MASTYSTNLAIELIGTGDQAGSWGNTTNTNLGTLIEQAISGYVTQAVSTGTDTTITIPNGATGVARNMYIELTGTGGASTNLIVPANKKLYFIFNNTSSGQVTVKVSGQTGVSVPNGKKMVLVSNGTDVVVAENYIADFGSNSATITNLTCTSLTLSNNPTFSGGTANGVLYLNGSKVATSGSALTFTGTNLGVGTSSPGALLQLGQDQATTDAAQLLLNDNASFRGEFGYSESGTTILHIANTYNDDASRFDIRMKGKTAADAKLTILGSGNVGIGTASPLTRLDVNKTTSQAPGGTTPNGALVIRNTAVGAGCVEIGSDSPLLGYLQVRNTASQTYYDFALQPDGGNVGIGTASPGSVGVSGYTRLVLGSGSSATDGLTIVPSGTGGVQFTDAANVKKGYLQWDSSTGALALGTGGTTKATLDSSGNLGIGTASPAFRLEVAGNARILNSGADSQFIITAPTDAYAPYVRWGVSGIRDSGILGFPVGDDALVYRSGANSFSTGTERFRITVAGNVGIGTASPLARLHVAAAAADVIGWFDNSHASTPYGLYVDFSAASPDNNTQYFFRAEDSTAVRCYIWSDGDLANHDGVYGTISDERLKQDIVDAGSQWDDLKSIRFRKYRMKTDVEANPDAPAMFGVVAQELAQVCPGLVDEHPNMKTVEVTDEEGNVTQTQEPDGTTTMTVKSSILLMKAAKALQEAMARIESLEADVAALKGAK